MRRADSAQLDSTPPLDAVYAQVRAGVQDKLAISPKPRAHSTIKAVAT